MVEREHLRILVVFDSVSPNRNTEKVANTISETLKEKGFEVDCPSVNIIDQTKMKDYDCVLAGSPTMAWSATVPIKKLLDIDQKEFTGKLAAAFDTRVKSRFSGSAARGIQNTLEKLGFKIVMPSLVAYVEGSTRKNDFQLKQGEIEKAKKYAEDLARTLLP